MPRPRSSAPAAGPSGGKIRIIGGRFRRTPIPVPAVPGLRPTPDRVRETLFNWLGHLWEGDFSRRSVLDPFAGSGALGLEAASRGVARVVMVERDRVALAALRALCARLNADTATVVAGDAMAALSRLEQERFDLILLDPPFGQDWIGTVLPRVRPLLAPGGMLYIEAEQSLAPPAGMEAVREGRAGAVHVHLWREAGSDAASA